MAARRTLALACLLSLAFALMPARSVVALAGLVTVEEHLCACPIGADGECDCPDCIRLDVHGTGRDAGDEAPEGPRWTTACDPGEAAPATPLLDPALVPEPPPRLAGAPMMRLGAPASDVPPLGPDLPGPEPPPRG